MYVGLIWHFPLPKISIGFSSCHQFEYYFRICWISLKKKNFFQSLLGRFISIVNFNKRTDIHTDSCQFHLKQQWDLVCITWYKKHHHFDFRSFFARVFGIFFRSKFIEKVNSFFQSLKFLENIQQYNHTLMNSMNNKCYLSEPFLNVQFISSRRAYRHQFIKFDQTYLRCSCINPIFQI